MTGVRRRCTVGSAQSVRLGRRGSVGPGQEVERDRQRDDNGDDAREEEPRGPRDRHREGGGEQEERADEERERHEEDEDLHAPSLPARSVTTALDRTTISTTLKPFGYEN